MVYLIVALIVIVAVSLALIALHFHTRLSGVEKFIKDAKAKAEALPLFKGVVPVLLFCLFVGMTAHAQQPEPTVNLQRLTVSVPQVKMQPVTDLNFWLSTAGYVIAAVLDTEQSIGFAGRGCHELNPLIGPHPSPWRFRGESYGTVVAVTTADYLIRRHVRHQFPQGGKLPKILSLPQWVGAGAHTAGFALTDRNGCGW
jgi:NADH:ubiquinone oxidoreductase subunit 5 (subunit L)/multisubunit Na+/H+ antiporter MnhA subunit